MLLESALHQTYEGSSSCFSVLTKLLHSFHLFQQFQGNKKEGHLYAQGPRAQRYPGGHISTMLWISLTPQGREDGISSH